LLPGERIGMCNTIVPLRDRFPSLTGVDRRGVLAAGRCACWALDHRLCLPDQRWEPGQGAILAPDWQRHALLGARAFGEITGARTFMLCDTKNGEMPRKRTSVRHLRPFLALPCGL